MATNVMSEVLLHLREALTPREQRLTDGQLLQRFVQARDEAAFADLVRRHSAMVWGVCRRVVQSHHDAEDAFQATFLVFVRKASSVVPRELVGNWLYGVAHQTAIKAQAMAVKKRAREKQVVELPEPVTNEPEHAEELARLDQELSRLPEKYRAVIVLCDLEGRTRKEVARQLDCPEGTIAGRLTRGRAMLARRLGRVCPVVASASVPLALVANTIQAATVGAMPPAVVALTEGVVKTMLISKLKLVTATVLLTMAVGVGGRYFPSTIAGTDDGGGSTQATSPQNEAKKADTLAPFDSFDRKKEEKKQAALERRLRALEDQLVTMNKEVASIRKELKALTAAPATQLKRYMLKHAQADEVAKLLQQVFGKTPTLRLATDGRTNSLLVHGLAEDQQTIEAIITRLDVDASVKPNK